MLLTTREYIALGILKAMLKSPHTFSSRNTISDYIQCSFSAADEFLETSDSVQNATESTQESTH